MTDAPVITAFYIAPTKTKLPEQLVAAMRKIWESIPSMECKGLCAYDCRNVPLMPLEALYLIEKYDAKITLAGHQEGKSWYPTLGVKKPCEFLKDGRCSIYEDRPLPCRIYGHGIMKLRCQHGCEPKPNKIDEETMLTLSVGMGALGLRDHDMDNTATLDLLLLVQKQVTEMDLLFEIEGENEPKHGRGGWTDFGPDWPKKSPARAWEYPMKIYDDGRLKIEVERAEDRNTPFHKRIVRTRRVPGTKSGNHVFLECGHRVMTFGDLALTNGVAMCERCKQENEHE